MNIQAFTGRIANDLTLNTVVGRENGRATSFSVAVRRPHSKDRTDFLRVVAYDKPAEFICKYFKKGDPIAITGYARVRQYETASGEKRTVCETVCETADFCGGSKSENKTNETDAGNESFLDVEDENLPF